MQRSCTKYVFVLGVTHPNGNINENRHHNDLSALNIVRTCKEFFRGNIRGFVINLRKQFKRKCRQ